LGHLFAERVVARVMACPFVPGAEEFLTWSATHYALFLASGTPEEELQEIVDRRGLLQLFSGVYGSPRTKEEILQGIMADRTWSSSELAFVGDGLTDAQAAAQCGVPFIGRVAAGGEDIFRHETKLAIVEDLRHLRQVWSHLIGEMPQPVNP
jgi:phosphoglycolate phosphatase-like HAD superfamily hydrolase